MNRRTPFILSLFLTTTPFPAVGQTLAGFDPAGAGLPLYRDAEAVAVLAVANSRWTMVPTDAHDMLGNFQFLPPYATDDTQGQVFELLEVEDGWAVADEEGVFVAVPWTVGCGCADEGWDQPGWVPPGDTVAFLLAPTRERVAESSPPVFDVLGWHQPFPSGDFIPYWQRTRQKDDADWLTAREFFEFLQTLPSEGTFRLDPVSSFEDALTWIRRNPDREGAFPIPAVIQEWERVVRENGR